MKWNYKKPDIDILCEKVIQKIDKIDNEDGEQIIFHISENEKYRMYHYQNCCESVSIEDIIGELDWLIGSPILKAEERSNKKETDNGSETYTFYEIATIKGSVTIRWFGSSNGYYSENITFEKWMPLQID